MTGEVLQAVSGAVAEITFSNPKKRNAMSLEMWQGLGKAVRQYDFDPEVRVIVLRGAGEDAFVSGADISEFDEERRGKHGALSYEDATQHALDSIRICAKPTIAITHGYCYGAGLAIATACDLRYARDDVKFSIPAAKLGFGYASHLTSDLINVVGPARTKEILITGMAYDARRAKDMGLVHDVFSAATFEEEALKTIETVASNAPLTMRAAKLVIDALLEHKHTSKLTDADRAVNTCFNSKDAAEGRHAFAEKRKPEFTGH